ncbi:hypothetical protein SAMN03159343_2909 [Klenkia marina]|uniref:Uncharacterized protein n=1 Tax=Klenkia marina TaxID=1960309 RepID=A0A1G4YHY2_9ACTN|nr:hypothetical protein [Klenkia marina]SCX53063.1 hypothetical protein SAMN03159343_2909 [Klenkia marina]
MRSGRVDLDALLLPGQRYVHRYGSPPWEPERVGVLTVLLPLAARAAAQLLQRSPKLYPHVVDGVRRWDTLGWPVVSWDPRGDLGPDGDVVLLLVDGRLGGWRNGARSFTPLMELRTPHAYREPLDADHLRWICDGILSTLWHHGCSDEEIRAVALPRTVAEGDDERDQAWRTRERTEADLARERDDLARRAEAARIPDVWP